MLLLILIITSVVSVQSKSIGSSGIIDDHLAIRVDESRSDLVSLVVLRAFREFMLQLEVSIVVVTSSCVCIICHSLRGSWACRLGLLAVSINVVVVASWLRLSHLMVQAGVDVGENLVCWVLYQG